MKIPKTIIKNNREYIFEKIYPNFIMYKDKITGVKQDFLRQELGLIKENSIMEGFKLNPDNVKV